MVWYSWTVHTSFTVLVQEIISHLESARQLIEKHASQDHLTEELLIDLDVLKQEVMEKFRLPVSDL